MVSAESDGNRIGSIEPDGGGLMEYPLPNPGSSPRIIAFGADGNIWFSEHLGNRMGRITPEGKLSEFAIPTAQSQPRAIALGADGNIWFGMFAGGKIGRITPKATSRSSRPHATAGPARSPPGPTATSGSPNTAPQDRAHHAAGRFTEFPLPRPNSGPGDITAGADGAMWFVELNGADGQTTDGNRVGRITMEGVVTEYPMPSQSGSAINIAVGPDGNVWYTKGGAARPRDARRRDYRVRRAGRWARD